MDGTAQHLVAVQRERLTTRQAMMREVLGAYLLGSHPQALSAWLKVPDYWQADRVTRELRKREIAVTSPGRQRQQNRPGAAWVAQQGRDREGV
jgi:DNA-binding transcriptional MocR family regulator